MIKVEIGQPVIVTDRGRSFLATVITVNRVWITILPDGFRPSSAKLFWLDTQTDGASVPRRFYTLDQWADKERRDAALRFLREQGITVDHGSPWQGREETLSELIRVAVSP